MLLIKTTDHMYYHTHVQAYVGIKYNDCGFMGYVYIKYNDGGFKVKFTRNWTNFLPAENSCVQDFRSHGITKTVEKF